MRGNNKYLGSIQYAGRMDKGGNDQSLRSRSYFRDFYDSKNLQLYGKIPNTGYNFAGGNSSVSPYTDRGGKRFKTVSVANMN